MQGWENEIGLFQRWKGLFSYLGNKSLNVPFCECPWVGLPACVQVVSILVSVLMDACQQGGGEVGREGREGTASCSNTHARLHIVFENKECLTGAHIFCPVKASRVLGGPSGGGR